MEKKLIALTGGIGSGKSFALKTIEENGFNTLSCDKIVSELYETAKVKRLLKKLFPEAVKGLIKLKIDRKKISELAFSSPERHEKLTAAVTPLVLDEVLKRAAASPSHVFVEVPLLFECGYQNRFDKVIVLLRDKAERIESVKLRSGLNEEQILARMAKQFDYEKEDLSSYTLIINDGNAENFKNSVLAAAKSLVQ